MAFRNGSQFKAYLPREHGGWFLFLVPLAVGLGVAGQWNGRGPAFAVAALALFLARPPLELALKAWRGKRTRADLPALLLCLAFYAALVAAAGGVLLLRERLWGLLPLAAASAGLLALQLWAAAARLARTAWSEVIGTAGLALAAPGAHYAAVGRWTATAIALWILMAVVGVGGVLYSRWRLRRRRAAARVREDELPAAPPRVSVLAHYALGLILAAALAWLGWAPWAVTPLYGLLLIRVAWGARPAARPDRTVLAIGLGEGIATIVSGLWIVLAYRLA
ncbi:MAG: YwiC-like family protein [Anaerolineae bacterium]